MQGSVLFLVVALSCALAEGRLVPKCELKNLLVNAANQLPENVKNHGLKDEAVIAKVICHAEYASGFNTSAVTTLNAGPGHNAGRRRRSSGSMFDLSDLVMPISNHLVCSDDINPTQNICGMACSKLIDDSIDDDIQCVLDIFSTLAEQGWSASPEIKKMIRLIYQEECRGIGADYLSDCP